MGRQRSADATSPWWYVTLGLLLAAFGSAATFAQESYDAPLWLGPLLLIAASAFTAIGAISLGVSLGITHAARQNGPVVEEQEATDFLV